MSIFTLSTKPMILSIIGNGGMLGAFLFLFFGFELQEERNRNEERRKEGKKKEELKKKKGPGERC